MEPLIVWNNPFGVDVPRTEKPGGSFAQAETVQQTFVLMKTSSRRLEDVFRLRLQKTSSRRLEDVLIKTNILALLKGLQKMSSRRLDQDQYIRLGHTSSRRLQGVLKTSSRRL